MTKVTKSFFGNVSAELQELYDKLWPDNVSECTRSTSNSSGGKVSLCTPPGSSHMSPCTPPWHSSCEELQVECVKYKLYKLYEGKVSSWEEHLQKLKEERACAEELGLKWQKRGPDPAHGQPKSWRGQKWRDRIAGKEGGRWGNRGGVLKDWYEKFYLAKMKGEHIAWRKSNPNPKTLIKWSMVKPLVLGKKQEANPGGSVPQQWGKVVVKPWSGASASDGASGSDGPKTHLLPSPATPSPSSSKEQVDMETAAKDALCRKYWEAPV